MYDKSSSFYVFLCTRTSVLLYLQRREGGLTGRLLRGTDQGHEIAASSCARQKKKIYSCCRRTQIIPGTKSNIVYVADSIARTKNWRPARSTIPCTWCVWYIHIYQVRSTVRYWEHTFHTAKAPSVPYYNPYYKLPLSCTSRTPVTLQKGRKVIPTIK